MDRNCNGPGNGDGHGNGYDHDCCGSTTAIWRLRFGGYDHGNGYDHDCCGSTTTALTTLAMVTIAGPMDVLYPPPAAPRGSGG